MKAYLDILKHVLDNGQRVPNRTGVDTLRTPPVMFQHDLSKGFPLLTTKKMSIKNIATELEFFIHGRTDKKWLQDRGCHIWDSWCNPRKVPFWISPKEAERFAKKERDLGPIYGAQWRNFNKFDQLKDILKTLKENPFDRRMVCSAWNPIDLEYMALPPCHLLWQVTADDDYVNLVWFQRSCDMFLGVPYNIASYGLLLHLIAEHVGKGVGVLTGMLSDAHIYVNHIEQVKEQLSRQPKILPEIHLAHDGDIFKWKAEDTYLCSYMHHPAIKAPVAV